MKLIVVNKYFLPYKGGVEFYINNLSNNLYNKFGVDLSILCKRLNGLPIKEKLNNVNIIRVNRIIEMFKYLNNSYSLIHVHMPRSPYTIIALIIAKIRGIPIVLTPHCFYQSHGIKKILLPLFDMLITKRILNAMDAVINLTDIDRSDAINIGLDPKKAVIIPNSIDDKSLSKVQLINFKSKYDINSEFLLHIGRFNEVKRIDWMIENVIDCLNNYILVLIGQDDGNLREINNYITINGLTDKVIILENIDDVDVRSAYRQAKLFIMTSRKEGLPTVLLESLYYGCPILTSDVGGIPLAFNNAPATILFKNDDIIDFKRKLELSLNLIVRQEIMKDFVVDKFSWDSNSEKVYRLYKKISNKNQS